MSATSTTVDAILRDDYKDYWKNVNDTVFMLSQVEAKRDTVDGRIARHAVHLGRSGAIGARAEGDDLPRTGSQRYVTVPVPVRWQTARIQLTVQLLEMANSQAGAFIDALEGEMNGVKAEAQRDLNRQTFGTSNGVIATCGTTTSSTTVQLASTTTEAQMQHLYKSRVIDIGTVASPTSVASAREITDFNVTNKTITISGAAVSTSSTHFVFNSGSGGASSHSGLPNDGQKELTGLQTIVSNTATLHTLTTTAHPEWVSGVYSNAGTNRPLSETMIDLAILRQQTASGKTINALVSNTGVFVAGKALLTAYQRNIDTMEFKGGFRGIKWSTPGIAGTSGSEIGWYADIDCPQNRLFGICFDALAVHQIAEGWQWLDKDGAILSRVQNKLSMEAALYTSLELACGQRNAHFVINDLTEASM